MDRHLSLATQVVLTPRRAGLLADRDDTVEILVRVRAPDAPAADATPRPPQALALVIDRSGSMAGRPLEQALRCAEHVVSRLRPVDAVSLVSFDNRIRLMWPAVPIGEGTAVRAAIASIRAGGNTNLHGGWASGADSLADVGGHALKRVILLSDGQANAGLVDPETIAAECAGMAAGGITTSTYGLGNGFNESLMVAMARAGGGNHYYGDTADDLIEPFEQELSLLDNLCLREMQLEVQVPGGVAVTMVNQLPTVDGGWRLPDLAWGAEAWAVLRLVVPAGTLRRSGTGSGTLLRVSITARNLAGDAVQLERAGLALPVMTAAAHAGLRDDETVSRRLVELAAADALTRMRAAAAGGDWATVDRVLARASRDFAGDEWVSAMIDAMHEIAAARQGERLSKEAAYSSGKLRGRLVDKAELARLDELESIPAFLRRKPLQGKADL